MILNRLGRLLFRFVAVWMNSGQGANGPDRPEISG